MSATRVSSLGADSTMRVPGDLLLGVVPLTAIGVLLLNDHVLKGAWPGVVTGKLSDAAGLVFFPFLLVGVWQLVARQLGRSGAGGLAAAVVAIVATGAVFALVKITPLGGEVYRYGLGFIQWPVVALLGAITGGPIPAFGAPVGLVADPSDLVALPALAIPLGIAIVARSSTAADWRAARDLSVSLLAVGMFVGAVVDGWAHSNLPSALETVLTPWHAIVYTSFALLVAVLVGDAALTARARPRVAYRPTVGEEFARLASLIAPGYGPTVVGAVVFVAAGLADTTWHVAFGLEADAEALVSPTHLLLGVGAALIALGPARSVWRAGVAPRWPSFLPAALAIGTVLGLVGFATHIASPYVDAWPVYPYDATSSTFWAIAPLGIAAVGLQSALVAGALAATLRLWPRPPDGTLSIVVLVGVVPLVFLHEQGRLIVAPLAGAAVAELVAAVGFRRGWTTVTRIRAVTTISVAAMWTAAVVVLAATGGVAWSAHLVGGAFVVAAVAGALVGVVATLPSPADEVESPTTRT